VRRAALAIGVVIAFSASEARAQARWDVGVEGGVERRVLASKPGGGADAGFGPVVEMAGHVALLPLLRLGAYAQYDTSPVSGDGIREIVSGGLDARIVLPWVRGTWRNYLRVGIGEAAAFDRPHGGSQHGHFTEVPVALGVAYRVVPWVWVTSELGARMGFAFGGAEYLPRSDLTAGDDTLAVYLTLGASVGR
jgi:hypothetical protein